MSNTNTERAEGSAFPHISRLVSERPWAILPSKLTEIVEVVRLRASGGRLSDEEIQARIGGGPSQRGSYMAGPVAVIPLYGSIFPKANLMTEMSGGTSVQSFGDLFRQAMSDDATKAVVFDIDSPGGLTDLLPELAAEIRGSRGLKPVVAVANTLAASAAYWIGSQADEVVVSPSGEVGSIGVFAAHTDMSGALEQAGLKTTLISAGKFKTEGNPYQPLDDTAEQAIQKTVDEFYGMFVADVAAGRRVTVGTVEADFGQGRVMTAGDAVQAGMADRVDTLNRTVARLAQTVHQPTQPPLSGPAAAHTSTTVAFTDLSGRAHDAVAALVDRAASLAELRDRGTLTRAKRDQLTDVLDQIDMLDGPRAQISEMLAATDPGNRQTLADPAGHQAEFDRAAQLLRTI